MASKTETTAVRLHRSTHKRLEELRPYESITWDEFIQELADAWEEKQQPGKSPMET